MVTYDYKLKFERFNPATVREIIKYRTAYPQAKLLIELPNTIGIKSSSIAVLSPPIIFRIAGGYTDERIQTCSKYRPNNGEDYITDVIYSRNELVKIIESIEDIEQGINENWTEIQKIVYIYDKLKNEIMYDPKFEKRPSKEIRSLRGLITRQTVCAGYSLIFKEILERQGIKCHYVESIKHAWNIVEFDGKLYPVDLTYDNRKLRGGKTNTHDYLAQDIESFCKSHRPLPEEPLQNYKDILSTINPALIRKISNQFNRQRDYLTTTYYGTRDDGSKYLIAQVGDNVIDGVPYYRYLYAEVGENDELGKPLLLYSETNVTFYMNEKRFGRQVPIGYEYAIDSVLFSKENIYDSLRRKSFYIGRVRIESIGDEMEFARDYTEIPKPKNKLNLFNYSSRVIMRSDGTQLICQRMKEDPQAVGGTEVIQYDLFEVVEENGKMIVKKNTIFTERDIYQDNRVAMADVFLSRERLDRIMNEAGGYVGYLDANNELVYNPDLVKVFTTNKKVGEYLSETGGYEIPAFDDLRRYATTYEVFVDSVDAFDMNPDNIKIRDIRTKTIVTNETVKNKALFANLWLTSAGLKWFYGESRPGLFYAFNERSKEIYNRFCSECIKQVLADGAVDSITLFKQAEECGNTDEMEIIVKLFRTPYQTDVINNFFRNAAKVSAPSNRYPEVLYTVSYAAELAYSSKYNTPSGR